MNESKRDDIAVCVVGLGYVGLPLALALSKHYRVVGFDIDKKKVASFKNSVDPSGEITAHEFSQRGTIEFTSAPRHLTSADFIIIAVPTPVDTDKAPQLDILEAACQLVGRNIKSGAIIVFESTVYPGVTEDICVPIIQKESGLSNDRNGFRVGYSPERINPGDKTRRLEDIVKIVSGQDDETLDQIFALYSPVIKAGLYRAGNIKIAEAAKVIENAQRDLNIAFVNELSLVFDRLGVDTLDVLEAAATKWNFAHYKPGLVGGHCIGIDPYYLTYKSRILGHHAEVISAARQVNESMVVKIADKAEFFLSSQQPDKESFSIGVLGIVFKENCADFRNSKVVELVEDLRRRGHRVKVHDHCVDQIALAQEHSIEITELPNFLNLDLIILAVAHTEYFDLTPEDFGRMCVGGTIMDLKGVIDRREFQKSQFSIWRM